MTWPLAKGHKCYRIIIHNILRKTFWFIIHRIGKIFSVAMNTQQRYNNAGAFFNGEICVGHCKILSAFTIQKWETRIFACGFCKRRQILVDNLCRFCKYLPITHKSKYFMSCMASYVSLSSGIRPCFFKHSSTSF